MVKKIGRDGFTLIEVMIAIAIFAVFVTVYISGESANIFDSIGLKEDTTLRNLAQNTMNELILEPPEFREAQLESVQEIIKFEEYPGYSYSIELKKLELPDFDRITGSEDQDQEQQVQSATKKNIYNQVKKNFEEAVWQIKIRVNNDETGNSYFLSTWLLNKNANMRFSY